MQAHLVDAGVANNSVSAKLMDMCNIHHACDWHDFEVIVKFIEEHLDDVINDVHKLDKLYLDDGFTYMNCPPAPEANDSHGNELIRTLSERQTEHGITIKREIKVHSLGPDPDKPGNTKVEVREDSYRPNPMGGDSIYYENKAVISVARK